MKLAWMGAVNGRFCQTAQPVIPKAKIEASNVSVPVIK